MIRRISNRKEAGQALVLTATGLVALTAMVGLAIDAGVMRYEKRLQQIAADSAAIAGAQNLAFKSGVQAAGYNAAAGNGFTDSGGNATSNCTTTAAVGTVCVQVNNPPNAGPHAGNSAYVEALVARVNPTYFMKVLGINSTTFTARAVATLTNGGPDSGCLYTLGQPTDSIEGVNINGSAILNAPTCGIVDNGNFNTKGNKLIVNAATFGTAGSWAASGPGGTVTCTDQVGPCPATSMPSSGDPLSKLQPPSQPAASASCPTNGACDVSTNGTVTLQPGAYSSISVGANSTVTFAPGVYYINGSGGLNVNGNSTIEGNGVTFYYTGTATVRMTGTPVVQLTAPSDGPYAGVLMYQDPNDTNVGPMPNGPTMGGNSSSFYKGALYFPSDQVTFFGNNTSFSVAVLVAQSLALSGNPTVNLQGTAGLPAGVSLFSVATLVE
jgi:hypothetical protein